MKKFLAVILSAIMVFGLSVPVYAEENQDVIDSAYPFVIVRGMNFDGLVADLGTENEHNPLKSFEIGDVVSTVFKGIAGAVEEGSFDGFMPPVMDYLDYLMGEMACDENGNSVYNTTMKKYPGAVADFPDLMAEINRQSLDAMDELGLVYRAVERYGADKVYYFNYDWRLSPLDTADELNALIEDAKTDHNTDKVNVVCCSMGGVVVDAYIYEYGFESFNKCIFDSTVFCGTYVVTDLLQGNVEITGYGLEYYLYGLLGEDNFFVKVLSATGVLDAVANIAMKVVDDQKDYVYDEFLIDTFATMPALWAIVLPDEYEACKNYIFDTDEDKVKYAELIAEADELQEMMKGMDELLLSLPENGVEVSVVAGYNSQLIPVYKRASTQGDTVLESALMLGRANVANMGQTLDATGEYVSPDGVIDMSSALFPDYTWAFKNMEHINGTFKTDLSDFIFWLVEYDGQPTIYSNSDYPQYMVLADSGELVKFP